MTEKLKISIKNLNVFYANKQALYDINLNIMEREVTSLIGPSGCGKSTLLKCLNRMNDLIDICSINGQIMIDGTNINDSDQDPVLLRSKVGMVFQNLTLFLNRFTITLLMGQNYMELLSLKMNLIR